jgi:hypothetical protein
VNGYFVAGVHYVRPSLKDEFSCLTESDDEEPRCLVRSLPDRERYVAWQALLELLVRHIYYLLFGHLLISAASTSRLFWQPSAQLEYYLSGAGRPYLRAAAAISSRQRSPGSDRPAEPTRHRDLIWALRKTNIFDGLSSF